MVTKRATERVGRDLLRAARNSLRRRSAVRGAAAVEFALTFPVLLMLLGVVDYATGAWTHSVLAQSVAQGAQFAMLTGTGVTASNIKTVVEQKLNIPAANVTVTGPACYCLSGSPATSASATCGSTCASGGAPGMYVIISASYTFAPTLGLWKFAGTPTLTESVTGRLQ